MNYSGQVTYQQRLHPPRHSDQADYGQEHGHRGESQREQNRDMGNRDPRELNQHTDYRFNASQQHRYPPPNDPQGDGYRNKPSASSTHRYPETFRANEQPSLRTSLSDPQRDGGGYSKQQYHDPNDLRYKLSESSVHQGIRGQGYGNQVQYGQHLHNRDSGNLQDGYSSERNSSLHSRSDDQARKGALQPDAYHHPGPALQQSYDQYGDDQRKGHLDWGQPRTQRNDFSPKSYDRSRDGSSGYNQREQVQKPYQDSRRSDEYNRNSKPDRKPSSEPPQILAKTSGSTAVFGIVTRADASPTKEYSPPFDQYRDNAQRREPQGVHQDSSQQNQPSSVPVNHRGHLRRPVSPTELPTDVHDQYLPSNDSRQSWHNRPGRGSEQRHAIQTKPGYGISPHTQYRELGPAHRDYEPTESSGYGSESTHNTERSYGEPQRFTDKGQYATRAPAENYSRSPPLEQDHGFGDYVPSQSSQGYDQRSNTYAQKPRDAYGPPVSVPGQGRYNDGRPLPPDNRYNQDYDRAPPPRQNQTRTYGDTRNTESGVEESHVPSVSAARNMFEKRSDPRRPPPAPKPVIAPKPGNVNARPIPPRPHPNLSNNDWGQGERRDQNPSRSQFDSRERQRLQLAYSQSMDNLDERSRYQPSSSQPPHHAQSMQNLAGRPMYRQSEENYLQPHGPTATDDRPMVVAVKFNQDTGPSVHTGEKLTRQGSWERSQPETRMSQSDYMPWTSPKTPHGDGCGWSVDASGDDHQQSYSANDRNAATNSQSRYGQQRVQDLDDESQNYVPDVVARSYELARQSQLAASEPLYNSNERGPYPNHRQEPIRDDNFDPRTRNNSENRNPPDRWPTPPTPIATHEQPLGRNTSYNDDWRRPGPVPIQPQDNSEPPSQPHNYRQANEVPGLSLPPPPRQPYRYDSDSSEVDVDAPTPPSTAQARATNSIGESHYERNKPLPVGARNPDSLRKLQHQPHNVLGQHPDEDHVSSKMMPSALKSKQPTANNRSSNKTVPPQKSQGNSTSHSPQFPLSPNDPDDFDLDVGVTQHLPNRSSRERMRLVKSGAMANRKPPSRLGSTSDLIGDGDKEDDYQIDVTDDDLSSRATPIEVHRLESMRVFKAKKGKERSSTSGLDRAAKQRASQKMVSPPTEDEDEPRSSKAATKGADTKLVYKVPSAEAAKIIPLPQVTEPAQDSSKRPPTYLGFGYTPEKPKSDLLSQFKSAKDSAIRTAAEKQNKALKSVSAIMKSSKGKKESKAPPKPKLTPAERNAKALDKMNLEVHGPPEKDHGRHHNRHGDERDVTRSSIRSSSTAKPERYDADDDTTNGSRHGRAGRGRGRGAQRERAKSRGRSSSRGRNLSPEGRAQSRHRSKSLERALSPEDRHRSRKGRSLSPDDRPRPRRQRSLSPEDRHRPRRQRTLSPDDRHRPRREIDDKRYYADSVHSRRTRDDESSYYRRSYSPPDLRRYEDDRNRYYQRPLPHRMYPPPPSHYGRYRPAVREPDWMEQNRQGRGPPGHHPTRRAWVKDPRRMEVAIDGRRRYGKPRY